ncbi:nickel-dependent lactate racemase [Acetobacterium wieringae]|uniref:Nickel-dependent lactate racemase n=1 Tax=Acetobacterium wieringae TaxID=52694 RepID=A0ABY6HDY8_9FIRM|nr:nickel-dependent lactate racemase [Acetobacterium wieringae]UYO62567.1 nickel-dependent lactate racemase [Acetobacterium wieringae]VUZ23303.1 Lactate racemase [Acetobacterium wieringae]
MKIDIAIGKEKQTVNIPEKNLAAILTPNPIEVTTKGEEAVCAALQNPIGTAALKELIKPGEKVVIITSDITRPLPSHVVLPPILHELKKKGIRCEDITIVFALGSHRKHSPEEMKKLVGDYIYSTVRCVDGDPKDFVNMGKTKHGTPVDVTRIVAEADRRICLGNIEYHYFAGYSGGAKAIMPGVSTRAAIQKNHSCMVDPLAVAGKIDDNPVRQDLEEAIEYCPIDFIVNVILDEKKNVIHAVAGHYIEAHREGCKFLDQLYSKPIDALADIVIVSQGGAPKDLNLYQTQKALDNAKHAVRDGGIIILVGSCEEGFGEGVFEKWLLAAEDSQSLIERIKNDFQLGGHKAAAIAMVLEKSEIFFVSKMKPEVVESIFMQPYITVQGALKAAFNKLGHDCKVLVMPHGGSTLPILKQ